MSTQSSSSFSNLGFNDDDSAEDTVMKLFLDCSLFPEDRPIDLVSVARKLSFSNEKSSDDSAAAEREARLTYGIQNAASQQYVRGFPFVRENNLQPSAPKLPCSSRNSAVNGIDDEAESLLVLTLCPPHDIEAVSPGDLKYLSFDLGFTIMEKNNRAYVMSVAKHSPAMLAGVQPFDRIKFAFAHTLSSPFRIQAQSSSSSGSISFLVEPEPAMAVYHASENESKEAAEYALSCVRNGQQTSFDGFTDLFPFDIMKSTHSHKPAQFTDDDDPILYPTTIVFERNSTHPDFLDDEVKKNVDDMLVTVFPFLKFIFCLQS